MKRSKSILLALLIVLAVSLVSCSKSITAPTSHSYETDDTFVTGEYLPVDSLRSAGYVTDGRALTEVVVNASSWENIKEGLKLYCKPIK